MLVAYVLGQPPRIEDLFSMTPVTVSRIGEPSQDDKNGNGEAMPADAGCVSTPAFKSVTDAMAYLRQHDVQFVLAQFVDIHGVAKTKSVPVSHFQDILDEGAGFAGFALWGFGMQPHHPDYMARGELSTLSRVPWQPGYARIVCTGYVNNQPYPYDTRWILNQQMKRLAERGWTLNTGLEPEFMLMSRNPDGTVCSADETDTLDKPCYDYKGLSRSRVFLEKLVGSLQQAGIDVYQIDHEDSNGQFEVNFRYSDAVTTADRMVFIRMAAGEIARELKTICTFMPKPMSNRTGSGMHMHLSIAPLEGCGNLFTDDSDSHKLGLSKLAYQFLGGLLKHAGALAALCAPTVNSYKRLVVGRSLSGATWAPAYISYGDNNRTSMVRVPYGRLELRLSDSSCNPYLATAAVIAAGLDGIDNDINPGPPHNFNHYTTSEEELARLGIGVLPQTLHEALAALEQDGLFARALGSDFLREFITIKRMEWVEYQRHVSDWEVDRYLQYF
jgi:glutamine synthetase